MTYAKHCQSNTTLMMAVGAVLALLGSAGCGAVGGDGGGDGTAAASSDASLSALGVVTGTLTPGFDPDITAYTVAVGRLQVSVHVTPTAEDAGATILVDSAAVGSGDAPPAVALAEGPNPVMVVVKAADGVTQATYTVVVTRAAAAQQAYVKASEAEADDRFGESVALEDDTLVVGAYREDGSATGGESDNGVPDAGAVYVFARTGTTWTQQAYLKASNAEADDQFGVSVALSGDTLVVGADFEDGDGIGGQADNSAFNAGAAYVFTRSGTVWTQEAYLKASNAGSNDEFGGSVALDGDTVVIGARREDSSGGGAMNDDTPNAGAAYVFMRTGTTWTQTAFLKASNADADDQFGRRVALEGDTVAVGAHQEDSSAVGGQADNSAPDAGAAYVFTRAGTTWTQQAHLKASNADAGDRFGGSVALSGETLAVGAFLEDSGAAGAEADNSAPGAGAAYVFVRAGAVWTQQAYLKASIPDPSDSFGGSVALFGDALAVGAIGQASSATGGEADNSAFGAGAVYVFARAGTAWAQQAFIKASNADANDSFGRSPALWNGTLAVGASGEDGSALGGEADNSASSAGAVYVVQ